MIKTQNLTKAFGKLYALRGIDLEVGRGEFLTLFGPNGAGKTTLIRILATLIRPTSGAVTIGGYTLKEQPVEIRQLIGLIGHQTFLYDELTAEENLKFYGKMYEIPYMEERVSQALEEVSLTLRRQHRVRTFSRGMQQRLSIARALLHDPPVLLLDEPYTGLDQHAAEIFTRLLRDLSDGQRTIVMTTHNLEQGMDTAHKIAVLVKGEIIYHEERKNLDVKSFRQTYFHLVDEGGR